MPRRLGVILLIAFIGPRSIATAQTPPDHAIVLGFERLHAQRPDARGGRVLLGELQCLSCHQASAAVEKSILKRQAPILDGVGGRLRPSHLRDFLSDPHSAKSGTTMPYLLGSVPEAQRKQTVEALVHFLASTGTLKDARPMPKSVASGRKLYHQVGCVACHGPRGDKLDGPARVLPLGDLARKHSIPALAAFLQDPHKTRPSGRMPGLHLSKSEANDLAHYLLADLQLAGGAVNLDYAYYEGDWAQVPDFAKLTPAARGQSAGFDLFVANRMTNAGLKFDGFFKIEREGIYTFHLTSDDGSKLWIDDNLVVVNDGHHAATTKSKQHRLGKGTHRLSVACFNAGGPWELEVEFEGPGMARQPLALHVFSTKEPPPKKQTPLPDGRGSDKDFAVDGVLVKKGREHFAQLGCASCHSLHEGGKPIASKTGAPDLAQLNVANGCLSSKPAGKAPRYNLSAAQRSALAKALTDLKKGPTSETAAKETIAHTFTTFNCCACHDRDSLGGVESGLNNFFQSTQKEMGDEGRIPPTLSGVGAKLTSKYLHKVIAEGSTDRPYMLTRMPKFGAANVRHLAIAIEAADPVAPVPPVAFSVTPKKAKSEGRHMVGGQAFGCIKCHNFREFKGGGVQGINMTILHERLRREWFHRYLVDPNKIRPGTRMPAVFPLGQSTLPKVLGGDAVQQIEAMWLYLADGPKAANPYGVGRDPMPLIATAEPILYRNFIAGAGTRAIGVGYPEKVNLAFDANDLRIALLWHKEFIDASRHWTDRGAGFEGPLGEGVLSMPPGPTFAVLNSRDAPWPDKAAKDNGYRFRGYHLDEKGRPKFLYEVNGARIEDHFVPKEDKEAAFFQRVLTVSAEKGADNLYFRAAAAKITDLGQGWFAIGSDVKMRLETSAPPFVRQAGGLMELLVPVREKQAKIVQEIVW
ncbi:MAG: c-type cytochrome [Gemmataceae bacterium]|nr:c-type cytochrome [Gemmataceae bacterium]MCI0739478.1 c-type cytochrome [Gemmataceae bacterium]